MIDEKKTKIFVSVFIEGINIDLLAKPLFSIVILAFAKVNAAQVVVRIFVVGINVDLLLKCINGEIILTIVEISEA